MDNKPYKVMKYHQKAVRQVVYHPKYPMFASSADDGFINIFHAKIYSDLSENALILPLKGKLLYNIFSIKKT